MCGRYPIRWRPRRAHAQPRTGPRRYPSAPHRLDYTLSVEYRAGPRSARRQDFRRKKMASGLTTMSDAHTRIGPSGGSARARPALARSSRARLRAAGPTRHPPRTSLIAMGRPPAAGGGGPARPRRGRVPAAARRRRAVTLSLTLGRVRPRTGRGRDPRPRARAGHPNARRGSHGPRHGPIFIRSYSYALSPLVGGLGFRRAPAAKRDRLHFTLQSRCRFDAGRYVDIKAFRI